MRKDVMTGVAVAVFALIVPLGLVLIESYPTPRKAVKKPVAKVAVIGGADRKGTRLLRRAPQRQPRAFEAVIELAVDELAPGR